MPEQLGLQQALGKGRTILREEPPVPAVGSFVNGAGHELLAGSAFSLNQDWERTSGCLVDQVMDLTHGLRRADDPVGVRSAACANCGVYGGSLRCVSGGGTGRARQR
jgi:hypothetical protein